MLSKGVSSSDGTVAVNIDTDFQVIGEDKADKFTVLASMTAAGRNPLPLPQIQYEELWSQPINQSGYAHGWQNSVCSSCRVNMHHTLASIRWNHKLKAPLVPKDSLDLVLTSIYTHGPEDFPEKSDVYCQPETVGIPTWRLLRNVCPNSSITAQLRDRKFLFKHPVSIEGYRKKEIKKTQKAIIKEVDDRMKMFRCEVAKAHPIHYGGIVERMSPFSVKLRIPSVHNSQTNQGYCRKVDGTYYSV